VHSDWKEQRWSHDADVVAFRALLDNIHLNHAFAAEQAHARGGRSSETQRDLSKH
jgi:hypothetical protein